MNKGAKTAIRIQVAAVNLVLKSGIDGTTVELICKAAKISERTFFNYFPTKDSAIIGTDFPEIDEQQVRKFLTAPPGDIFSESLALIKSKSPIETSLMFKRVEMMQKYPQLFAMHLGKLMSIRAEHQELIELRLRRNVPGISKVEVKEVATAISEIAASVLRIEMEKHLTMPRPGRTPPPNLAALGLNQVTDVGAKLARWVEIGRNA